MSARFFVRSLSVLLIAGLVSFSALWATQEEEEEGESPYTQEEYNIYQQIVNEPDLAKREDGIIQFIKTNPESALVEYAIPEYIQLFQNYQSQGQLKEAARAAEKFLTVQPDNIYALDTATSANFQLQNFSKAASYGEKAVEQKPDFTKLAFIVAMSHLALKNDDQVLKWGPKACAELEPKDCLDLLIDQVRIHAERKEWDQAASTSKTLLQALESAPPREGVTEAEWSKWVKTRKASAYAILGKVAAEREKWAESIQSYQQALKVNPGLVAIKAEAYYYIGRGLWSQGKIDPAMEAFAKGSVQNGEGTGPFAGLSRKHLEHLYRETHNGSLAGLDEFVSRATSSSE